MLCDPRWRWWLILSSSRLACVLYSGAPCFILNMSNLIYWPAMHSEIALSYLRIHALSQTDRVTCYSRIVSFHLLNTCIFPKFARHSCRSHVLLPHMFEPSLGPKLSSEMHLFHLLDLCVPRKFYDACHRKISLPHLLGTCIISKRVRRAYAPRCNNFGVSLSSSVEVLGQSKFFFRWSESLQ